MATGANPRYVEELRIGGGFGDPIDGGADIDKSGNISADGDIVAGPKIGNFSFAAQTSWIGGVYVAPNKNIGTLSAIGNSSARVLLEDYGGTANQRILEIQVDGAASSWGRRTDAGTTTSMLSFNHANDKASFAGDVAVAGGDIDAGAAGGMRGVVAVWNGSGGNAPGCIKLASPNGTVWYLFIEDDGTLKVHSALPTQNADGAVVGLQF